jgi:hypothetical protein
METKTYKRVYAKKQEYNGLTFDSKLEKDFYVACENNGIKLERESKEFVLFEPCFYYSPMDIAFNELQKTLPAYKQKIKRTYLQKMFYIPDFCYRDIYIETKGYQF